MDELIGRELGPYRILEQIGAGGMSTVYKAYHAAMDRYVAVKILPTQMGWDTELHKRFDREVKVIARLEHPRILPVHDYGESGKRLYMVMRYIEAGTLKDRLSTTSMGLAEVDRILQQVGGALNYAHRLGVVHRDIKPSNVLMDAHGDCYLTDFGLAQIMEASIKLTATGVGVGTPAYMSPEQGQGEQVDACSDIYSLGVMLYEMVTGQVPYRAETPMAVVLKHINAPLPLPRSVKPDLPEEVERVILKAMAKNPDDRFQTVGEMVAAFGASVRLAEAERPTVVPAGVPAEAAGQPSQEPPARAIAGTGKAFQAGWVRAAAWTAIGAVALLAFFLILSRIPLKVRVRGGQLEVMRVVDVTPTAATPTAPATQPAASLTATREVAVSAATATPTSQPTATFASTPMAGDTPVLTMVPTAPQEHASAAVLNSTVEQARAFAEPILSAIANKPPDYADDFSDPSSGWPTGSTPAGDEWGYQGGAYSIAATYRPRGDCCIGAGSDHVPPFSDLVLDVDVQVTSGESGGWYVLVRDSSGTAQEPVGASYGVGVYLDGMVGLWKNVSGTHVGLVQGEYFHTLTFIKQGLSTNHLTIIAQGPQIAIYVNEEPVWFVQDESSSRGLVHLGLNNGTPNTVLRVRFDNLKVWDISALPRPSPARTSGMGPQWERAYDGSVFRRADVAALAVDPQDPNVVYAATGPTTWSGGVGVGMFKSTDGGETWAHISAGIPYQSFSALLVDPLHPQTLYAATTGEGLYKSIDGGMAWRRLTGIPTTNPWSAQVFGVDPADSQHLYFLNPDYLYETRDGGESWKASAIPCGGLVLAVDPKDGNHLVMGNSATSSPGCAGFNESTDGGQTWSSPGSPAKDGCDIWALAMDPQDARILYAQYGTSQSGAALAKSSDGGKTWTRLRQHIGGRPGLAVSPANSGLVIAAEPSQWAAGAIHRSVDGGAVWEMAGSATGGANAVVFAPGDPHIVYLASAGVYRSTDRGASWTLKAGSFPVGYLALYAYPSKEGVLFAEDRFGGLYRSEDGGATWAQLDVSGFGLGIDARSGTLYRSDQRRIWRSTDAGKTWTSIPNALGCPEVCMPWIHVNPADAQTLYLDSGVSLYESGDAGQTWPSVPKALPLIQTLTRLYFGPNGRRVYDVAADGTVFVSDDGGQTWEKSAAGGQVPARFPVAAFYPGDADKLLVAVPGYGIRKTEDGGQTWMMYNAGLTSLYLNSLAFDPTNPKVAYAATDGGLFYTANGGTDWHPLQEGLGANSVVYSVAVDPNDSSKVYAATPDGVYGLAGQ